MAAAVLAGPPGECCTKTVQHVGDPRGTIERIAGVETYIASPPSGTTEDKIILFFADIFGPLYVNSQLLMDYWADNGESTSRLYTLWGSGSLTPVTAWI